ncbi:MAG: DUF3850 domain-containing protein [Minisyncoccota bacterium]
MAIIKKKAWPQWFGMVLQGKKGYDLRLDDFTIAEGDTFVLEEWDPKTKKYTGRSVEKMVTYVGKFKLGEPPWTKEEVAEKGFQIISLK